MRWAWLDSTAQPRQDLFGYYGEPGTPRFKIMVRHGPWKYIYMANGGGSSCSNFMTIRRNCRTRWMLIGISLARCALRLRGRVNVRSCGRLVGDRVSDCFPGGNQLPRPLAIEHLFSERIAQSDYRNREQERSEDTNPGRLLCHPSNDCQQSAA